MLGKPSVGMAELEHAKDRVMMGAERKSAVLSEENRRLTAYHEGGHALVAMHTAGAHPVHKATIVPRGMSLGMVMQLPEKDETSVTRRQLLARLDVCMGGRVAEELVFGEQNVTPGASNDFQQVTRTARMMITQMGFSKNLGQLSLVSGGGPSFLGNDMGRSAEYSQATADAIEAEVKELVMTAYRRAKDLIVSNRACLDKVAEVLLDKESIDGDEFESIFMAMKSPLYLKADAPGTRVPFTA
jgi:ATP-dependent Zn protease